MINLHWNGGTRIIILILNAAPSLCGPKNRTRDQITNIFRLLNMSSVKGYALLACANADDDLNEDELTINEDELLQVINQWKVLIQNQHQCHSTRAPLQEITRNNEVEKTLLEKGKGWKDLAAESYETDAKNTGSTASTLPHDLHWVSHDL